jgi:hypothetical protein
MHRGYAEDFFLCELGVAEIGDCAADSLLDKSRYSHVLTLVYLAFGRRYRHLSEWTRLVRVVSVNTTYIMIPWGILKSCANFGTTVILRLRELGLWCRTSTQHAPYVAMPTVDYNFPYLANLVTHKRLVVLFWRGISTILKNVKLWCGHKL